MALRTISRVGNYALRAGEYIEDTPGIVLTGSNPEY